MELTILMPCLNEALTLKKCIEKALLFLKINQIDGEVLIADNGSTDGSQQIARITGARLIHVANKGYGSALYAGIQEANGEYVIMGDADDSYNFSDLMPFITKLRSGYDLVMGNRFKGGIEKKAMPFMHRYFGNPIISFTIRLLYKPKIGDANCGLRGFKKNSIKALNIRANGMDFALEMIIKATAMNYLIVEVPTTLSKDGRDRPPHLKTFSDGWLSLQSILFHNPLFLFLLPSLLCLIGLFISAIGSIYTSLQSNMSNSWFACSIGFLFALIQFFIFYLIASWMHLKQGGISVSRFWQKAWAKASLEKLLWPGLTFGFLSIVLYFLPDIQSLHVYKNFIRLFAAWFLTIGLQLFINSFFLGIFKWYERRPLKSEPLLETT